MDEIGRTATVLVVEDEAEFRLLLRVILERAAQARVVGEAVDGLDAVELATEHRPDVVLLDVHVPRADGLAVADRIGKASPGSRVIAMSSDPETRLPALRRGIAWIDKARLLKELPELLESAGRPGVVA